MNSEEDGFKKKREEFSINIRKNNREDILNKRRNLSEPQSGIDQELMEPAEHKPVLIVDERYRTQIEEFINEEYDESSFDSLAALVSSSDVIQQHRGMIGIRKLLSKNVDPPIQKFVDKNLIFICIWFVKQKEFPQLKLEATWSLTNVASGQPEFCEKIYDKGGIELFLNLLKENEVGIIDQAIWGIGNLAADHVKYRDEILKGGGMQALINVVKNSQSNNLIKNGTWAIANLCRGYPAPNYTLIKESLPLICKVLKSKVLETSGLEILADAMWVVSCLTESKKNRLDIVHSAGILDIFFKYAYHQSSDLYVPAIKTIGNFSNGNENHTQALIDNGIFDLGMKLLNHPKKQMRREICWTLSNISAGGEGQVQQFMSRQDLLDKIAIIFNTDEVSVRKEVCWIYSNLGHLGDRQALIKLCLHYETMRSFANLLNETDAEVLENVLETLFKLLSIAEKHLLNGQNLLLVQLINNGGGERLESLQRHPNKAKVYDNVIKILTKFFVMEDENI